MQTSGIPARVAVPFADSGTKNTIPVPSQVAITPGLASYTTGFPPLTMTPITAGGVPPYGADFNGILNAITNAIRWNSAGSGYPFDSTFAGTVSGYPKGALLPASDYSGYWLNTIEANATSPENSTSATTGWIPGVHYGVTAITGLAAASVTLTTLQAAKPRITLSGTLTANINLVFPAWTRSWTVANNCTGNFSVTCKTPSGTGVTVPNGLTAVINGDGVNITQDSSLLGISGRLVSPPKTITSSGTYTPTPGISFIIVEVQAAGGGGGGAAAGSSTSNSVGGGGGSGAYAKVYIANPTSQTVTIGSPGSAGAAGGNGGLGGNTSFGSLISCPGGNGGTTSTVSNTMTVSGGGFGDIAPTISGGTTLVTTGGNRGMPGFALNGAFGNGGNGGTSILGSSGFGNSAGTGGPGGGWGAGGGGALTTTVTLTGMAGGAGSPGVVIVWEYY